MDYEYPPAEQLQATAARILIAKEQRDAAVLLLNCEVKYAWTDFARFELALYGPLAVYEALTATYKDDDDGPPISTQAYSEISVALSLVTPNELSFQGFFVNVQLDEIQPGWRETLLEIAQGQGVHNQGVPIQDRQLIEWNNLRFRSQAEMRIARALDAVGVLFLPNCLARLNQGEGRITKEADFLVCQNGKWGVLEVDGPYHPRAATDHERDRLFQQHGIKVTQRFTAEDCFSDAPRVVRQFLTLLQQNG
jgi:hypothetical protein